MISGLIARVRSLWQGAGERTSSRWLRLLQGIPSVFFSGTLRKQHFPKQYRG